MRQAAPARRSTRCVPEQQPGRTPGRPQHVSDPSRQSGRTRWTSSSTRRTEHGPAARRATARARACAHFDPARPQRGAGDVHRAAQAARRLRRARRAAQPAGAHASAAGRASGAPLPQPRRAAGRPDPGRDDRPDQVGRPLRPGARRRVLHVRDPDGRRRDQAALPRQGLGGARPAPPPGAAALADHGDGRAVPAARPRADGARAGRAAWRSRRRRSWRAWSRPTPTARCRWTSPTPTTSPRRSPTRWAPRTRPWRASSTASRSSRCWRSCRRGRRRSCCCASSAT